jgi:hypothetical protein
MNTCLAASLMLLTSCASVTTNKPDIQAPRTGSQGTFELCPVRVYPEFPGPFGEPGTVETVLVEATISRGRVHDVKVLSGSTKFKDSIVAAMNKYECISTETDRVVQQKFVFKME